MTATPAPALTAAESACVAAFESAPYPVEVAEAALVETVARAICESDGGTWRSEPADFSGYRANAAAAIAAYRAAQDGGAEEADENGCPDRPHHGVDCPGDACRFAALATQAGGER